MCQCCIVVTLNRSTSERWCREWWHTKTSNHALICCLPSSKQMPSYYPCSPDVENALQQFIFCLNPFTTGKKDPRNKPALDRLCCNTLKPSDVVLHHRMHVNTRLQLRPEVRAACARALWNPFLSLCFCLLITWHHKPCKTERDSQTLVQIMVLRTQTAPHSRDEVGGMLLNATWRFDFKNTSAFMKKGIHVDELFDESIFTCNYMHHTELTFERNKWILSGKVIGP